MFTQTKSSLDENLTKVTKFDKSDKIHNIKSNK